MMVPDNLYRLNYPIETEEAEEFWGSRHKCNRAKSLIAFSTDLVNANDNFRRWGYKLGWRKKAIRAFGMYYARPDMKGITMSDMEDPWWKCMPVHDDNQWVTLNIGKKPGEDVYGFSIASAFGSPLDSNEAHVEELIISKIGSNTKITVKYRADSPILSQTGSDTIRLYTPLKKSATGAVGDTLVGDFSGTELFDYIKEAHSKGTRCSFFFELFKQTP